MKLNKIIANFIVCLGGLIANACFPHSPETIHFATEATYPPFEYVDASGQIKGFDIDVAKALCQQMHADCTFSNQPFNSLIPSLNLGKFDALIAALGITPERAQQVAFTNVYYEPSASIVALTSSHYQLNALAGKTIGLQIGSTFEKYLKNNYHNKINLKFYASIQNAYLDLTAGRIDGVIADTPIAIAWLNGGHHKDDYSVIDKPILNKDYFGAGYGIAVSKTNTQLLNAFNQALAQIKANGKYQAIVNAYFHTNWQQEK